MLIVGYGVAAVTQILIFTVISITRSFALRRLFEAVQVGGGERQSDYRG